MKQQEPELTADAVEKSIADLKELSEKKKAK